MIRRGAILLISVAALVLPSRGDAQGADDEAMARYVPWSGSYWPIRDGWLIQGPLRKYDLLTGHRASQREMQENPPSPTTPDWYGYCHAWSAAAVMDREPVQVRTPKSQGGMVVPLGIGDQKGMLTACHTDDIAQHYGVRFRGEPGEDGQDIYPDELWRVLRLYIKERGVPIIVDTEAGVQVWNYLVYAYRVRYRPMDASNRCFAEMSLWMADDSVPPDIIGAQVAKQTYYFTFQLRDGSAVLGSGRWYGPSVGDHPDFAWFPYLARAENPEIVYDRVKELVDASGAGPSGSAPMPPSNVQPGTTPSPPPNEVGRPLMAPGNTIVPPNVIPGIAPPPSTSPGVAPATSPSPGGTAPITTSPGPAASAMPYVLSPQELLQVVVNQNSQFTVDVTVDKFDGGQYGLGESFTVSGTSARKAYLYLLYIDNQGRVIVLFPRAGEANQIPESARFQLPRAGAGYTFQTLGPAGVHRIKAVATTRPLFFSHLSLVPAPGSAADRRPFAFHLPPSQTAKFKSVLERNAQGQPVEAEVLAGASPQQYLGDFGQDEVAFYVGPADDPK